MHCFAKYNSVKKSHFDPILVYFLLIHVVQIDPVLTLFLSTTGSIRGTPNAGPVLLREGQ